MLFSLSVRLKSNAVFPMLIPLSVRLKFLPPVRLKLDPPHYLPPPVPFPPLVGPTLVRALFLLY
jgi:hypothetical protein